MHVHVHTLIFIYFRLKRLEVLAEKFNRKATNMENWTSGRADELQRNDDLEEANLAGIQVRTCTCANKYSSTNVVDFLF